MALSYIVILRLTAKLIKSFSYLEKCLSCVEDGRISGYFDTKYMTILPIEQILHNFEDQIFFLTSNRSIFVYSSISVLVEPVIGPFHFFSPYPGGALGHINYSFNPLLADVDILGFHRDLFNSPPESGSLKNGICLRF